MKTLRYSNNAPVRLGDIFIAPRWGTCAVKQFDRLNACAVAVNTQTGEEFDFLGRDTFAESDLIRRKPENITRARLARAIHRMQSTDATVP